MQASEFQAVVWEYYQAHGRHDLPWRKPETDGSLDPYKIVVSEVMLQQTQVARVVPKYEVFLRQFPDAAALAEAPRADVLRAWNGLGYNRRALYLWQAARAIVGPRQGVFPQTADELQTLPGIGAGTAGAIIAYAFNRPAVFAETNVRTVFIYHFLKDQARAHAGGIQDRHILELVQQTLPAATSQKPRYREWYWALTDYGVHLKQTVGNLNRHSRSYGRQSKFEGSQRQVRGQVLRLLGERPQTKTTLSSHIGDSRLPAILDQLLAEGLITWQGGRFSL